ncbi:MAG: type II toxin-antitoxin system HipA family toxin [Burkholderiales bacterium]|nr:type II toxin-antitoxin system HipA family toxin [Burkholderiales bacterium]
MARRKSGVSLNVFLNSRLVGRLNRAASGAISFQYDPVWLEWENALPISLSLPLRETRFTGASVIAYFDNLLPDNEPIRRQLAERMHADGYDACRLLAVIGRDCVGALQFLPEGQMPGVAGALSSRPITNEEIARKLADLARAPLGLGDDEDFRISIAGVQEKTALLRLNGEWHIPHGTTATTHILKPQMGMLPSGIDLSQSVENEYFCLQFLAALGLPVARTEIADFDGQRVLVIERFDRLWTRDGRLLRLPQEDCCQALATHPSAKYESEGGPGIARVLDLLKASDDALADRRLFLKAQVAYWLLGATDGHAKNFSLRLMPGARFRLTPLYDVMSAQPPVDAGQIRHNRMKFAMAAGTNRHYVIGEILPRHFRQTATASGIPNTTVDEVFAGLIRDVPSALDKALASMPPDFPRALAGSIIQGVRDRLRLFELAAEEFNDLRKFGGESGI